MHFPSRIGSGVTDAHIYSLCVFGRVGGFFFLVGGHKENKMQTEDMKPYLVMRIRTFEAFPSHTEVEACEHRNLFPKTKTLCLPSIAISL